MSAGTLSQRLEQEQALNSKIKYERELAMKQRMINATATESKV